MKVKGIKKGIHPEYNKELTNDKAIKNFGQPKEVIIPLCQHIGSPAERIVEVGDSVKIGQKIAEKSDFISANIHASISGEVVEITEIDGVEAVKIKNDNSRESNDELKTNQTLNELSTKKMREMVTEAGIVGLGGATFPTHVKMTPCEDREMKTLIINGSECEPYLTIDHRIMLERSEDIIYGLKAMMKMTDVKQAYIGIEVNKQDAIEQMKEVITEENIEVVPLKVKYPQGGEKQMIEAILDKEVPSGAIPLDIGVVVNNVGTVLAIAELIKEGSPLYQRGVTVTGAVKEPGNYMVPIGTPIKELIKKCGGFSEEPGKIIEGGPMTGQTLKTLDTPIKKGSSGVLVLTKDEVDDYRASNCIRCAKCVDHCPINLMPTTLSQLSEFDKLEGLINYDVMDCIECGCCSYVCPAKIELLDWIKLGKKKVEAAKIKDKQKEE